MRQIKRILVANRGEIACRIMRTARAMGLESIAVYSDADREAMHVHIADLARHIGPAPAEQSYLAIDRIMAAARESGADAIHPGYGFLSENADFAQACADEGIVFIGPSPSAMRAMASKSAAKALMAQAGVPLVPGYHGDDQSDAVLLREAQAVGYPILVKASAGGGGRGMRIVPDAASLPEALASARREARAAFGDERLLLERYLEYARHIEVQVFGDRQGNLVHMFERDCSIQRRYQKLIEEAPAPDLSSDLRARLHDAALRAARAVAYENAGTVEFIVAGDDAYFMEMNTRLQVEHPVTEAVTGLDLVEWQIRIARGEPLPLRQEDITCSGHAIEARIYAEDPQRDFLPQSGALRFVWMLCGQWSRARTDTWLPLPYDDPRATPAPVVPPYYDALLAKLVSHEDTRAKAVFILTGMLGDVRIWGVATNRHLLAGILRHGDVAAGPVDTGWLDRSREELIFDPAPPSDAITALAAVRLVRDREAAAARSSGRRSPWSLLRGWRLNQTASERIVLHDGFGQRTVTVSVVQRASPSPFHWSYLIAVDGHGFAMDLHFDDDSEQYGFTLDGEVLLASLASGDGKVAVMTREVDAVFEIVDPLAPPASAASGGGHLFSPMPGTVAAVAVAAGDAVTAGQTLIVIEAMKMEHAVRAPRDGAVSRVDCALGDLVAEGAELVVLETAP